jgi:pimeloyl-ACP methyl ester carboxylesterase
MYMIELRPIEEKKASRQNGSRLWRWLRYGMLGLAIMIFLLLMAGSIYQAIGEAADARDYPPPGMLVDVGGHQMHIHCTGHGSPTVILDHVADTNSAQWALVQTQLSKETQVCSYDRAGFGWSDPGPAPRDTLQNARELHRLLTNAELPGPYLLVGHSYGGNVSRVYAMQYPDEVAGMVLVDPGVVYDRPGVPSEVNAQWKERPFIAMAGPWLVRFGVTRLAAANGLFGYGDLPEEQGKAFVGLQLTKKLWQTLDEVSEAFPAMSSQVLEAEQHLGDIPVIVLSAELPMNDFARQAWTDVNASIARMTTQGEHRIVPGTDHMSFALQRDHAQVTSDVILELVKYIRTN